MVTTSIFSDRSKDGDLCYKEMTYIDTWMNTPANKKALGVNPQMDFQSCNMEVNQAFFGQGDGMHNSAALLPELIDDDIKLLVYAGNADMMCNFIVSTGSDAEVEVVLTASLPGVGQRSLGGETGAQVPQRLREEQVLALDDTRLGHDCRGGTQRRR